MTKFICKNCDWSTDHFASIQRHLMMKNKNKCFNPNKKDNGLLNLDEKFIYSIIPHDNNGKQEIKDVKNIKNIHLYMDELIEKIKFIYLNKIKCCPYCNKDFLNYQKLKNHIIFKCFMDYKNDNNYNKDNKDNNNNEIKIENLENNLNNNIISNSVINNKCKNNINNNVNIQNLNIEIKYPISFIEEDWNLEKIDDRIQKMISINKFAYSNLLKEILKNNINHNVYIDKDKMTEQGMVFSNKNDKFVPMSLDNIINRSMEQLNKLLLYINNKLQSGYKNIFEDREYNIDINNILESKYYIRKKYNKFLESKKIKDEVKILFTEIFNDNNEVSKKLYEEFMTIIEDLNIEDKKIDSLNKSDDNNY